MERRAFTILELLIAIAVLLAIVSMVMPSVYARLIVTRDEEARSMLNASIIAARAEAARTGDPVRVLAHERQDFTVDIIHEPMRAEHEDDAYLPAAETGGDEIQLLATTDERALGAEIDVSLPPGCRFVPASWLDEFGSVDAIKDNAADDRQPAPDRTIAVLLPDGGAVIGESLALITPRGRAFTMSIQTWAGGAAFDRWTPEEEETGMEFLTP